MGKNPPKTLGNLRTYNWHGNEIHYRPGTSDHGVIYIILVKPEKKAEYWVPRGLEADVILDIGGNIGVTAIYLAKRFPAAQIYTFEPVPQNFKLLEKNVEHLSNVEAFPFGLGSEQGMFEIYSSEDDKNLAGYSLHELVSDGINAGVDRSRMIQVEIRPVSVVLAELGITKIDIIKIDSEGAEFDILTSIDPKILARGQWILGEPHGVRDFELLAYLAEWFDRKVSKKMGSNLFPLQARSKILKEKRTFVKPRRPPVRRRLCDKYVDGEAF